MTEKYRVNLSHSLIYFFLFKVDVSPVHGICYFIKGKLPSVTEKLYCKTPDLEMKYYCLQPGTHYQAAFIGT